MHHFHPMLSSRVENFEHFLIIKSATQPPNPHPNKGKIQMHVTYNQLIIQKKSEIHPHLHEQLSSVTAVSLRLIFIFSVSVDLRVDIVNECFCLISLSLSLSLCVCVCVILFIFLL